MSPAAELLDDELADIDLDAPEPGSDDDEDAPAHSDLGYEAERPAPPQVNALGATPIALPTEKLSRGVCRLCQDGFDKEGGVALFPPPGRIDRTVCAVCQGKRNREIVEQTKEVIRDLKAAVAVGNTTDERAHMKCLIGLVGEVQANETMRAIAAKHNEPSSKRGGRR